MKAKLGFIIGLVVGTLGYYLFKHGTSGVDSYRVAFVAGLSAIVIALLPSRWFERRSRPAGSPNKSVETTRGA